LLILPKHNTQNILQHAYLDFSWGVYQAWDAAFNDYNLWLSRDDVHALTRACTYQRDDVRAMQVVWSWMVQNSTRDRP
jgi:hypothetical protein